ncbi:non-ribosomal peptide synthetase [Acanthopleuribacter pedis]|uniref:Amino acid adenylation domain-containing protein n=1 Tax=Acanthopleuribacter pedis TaxID=442870 RepID=A0A8J7Q2L7_9BACT|nr:non-ribosomal peptide synthetase [Acanthopleuribacter pedis]MBO1319417.1 amino acid adenylation domain-containing protein [Acanthopleuribacter pedis]
MTTTTLSKTNIHSIYNLSPLQTGLLFHAIESEADSPYHAQHTFAVEGALEPALFAQAWRTCLARHPILRSAFFWQQVRQPIQIAAKEVDLPLQHHDWRDRSSAQQEDALAALLAEDRAQGFNLNQPPLLRLHLIQRGAATFWFILSSHHLILDGWSMALVLGEIVQMLLADASTPPLNQPRPFEQYIAWLKTRNPVQKEAFWRKQLAGFSAPTSFGIPGEPFGIPGEPFGIPGEPFGYTGKTPPYRERLESLGPALSARLEAWCRRHGLTTATLVNGAWALLLSRFNGQDDVVYGTTVAGRPPELDGSDEMVGMFINTLPSRVRLPATQKVTAWLRDLQNQQHQIQDYSDTPLVDIQRWSDLPETQRNALFDTLVVFENYPVDEELRANRRLRFEPRYACLGHEDGAVITHGRNHYPLTLIAVPDGELRLGLAYDLRFVDHAQAKLLLARLKETLLQLCEHPDSQLGRLSLLRADERQQHLAHQGRAAAADEDFAARFRRIAAENPAATALVYEDQRLSYRELDTAAEQLAGRLFAAGVRPGGHVALVLEREPQWIVAVLAIHKAGASFVPLDADYPAERLRFILADSAAGWVLGRGDATFTPPAGCRTLDLDQPGETAPAPAPVSLGRTQPAYLIYTSGTSGTPKGVAVSHGALLSYVDALQIRLASAPGESLAALATVAADLGYTAIMVALAHGRTLRLLPHAFSFDGDALAASLAANPVDHLKITPSHLRGLLSVDQPQRVLPRKTLILGGEACEQSLVQRALALVPGLRVLNHYGPTEATVGVLTADLDGRTAPILGEPLANSEVTVLDRRGLLQPPGFPGEIMLAGHGLANGYHGNPRLTAERFRPNPFSRIAGARLYHSGDRGVVLAEGGIQFLGRIDQQVKIRGFRVEPAEIAARLKTLDGVDDAVVIAREGRLLAYLIGNVAAKETAAVQLARHLPDYMIPAAFIHLNQLPLTVNGKLDTRALPEPDQVENDATGVAEPRDAVEALLAEVWRDLLQQPKLGMDTNLYSAGADSILVLQAVAALRRRGVKVAPRQVFQHPTIAELGAVLETPTRQVEKQLLELWRELLGNDRLDRHADFYAAGGDSIKALQMTAAARRLGLPLNPRLLFQNPNPALLAQALGAQNEPAAQKPAGPAPFSLAKLPAERLAALRANPNVVDVYPVAPIQHGMLLDCLLDESARPYFNQVVLDVAVALDHAAMARACDYLVQRHDILRTGFVWENLDVPHQVVFAKVANPFQSHTGPDATEQHLKAYCAADLSRGFAFQQAPLWRLAAFASSDNHTRLVWSHHHLILDGWSLPQLLQELLEIYALFKAGQTPTAADAPRYACYLQWLGAREATAETTFWREQLADYPGGALLPGQPRKDAADAVLRVALDRDTTHRLNVLAQSAKVTLNTLVQAAWALTLARRNDRDDVVFGITHAGRNLPVDDIDRILGVFINTVPLRLQIPDELSVRDWLTAIQQHNLAMDTFVHTRLSTIIQRAEQPAESPLFESIVSFKNLPAQDETQGLSDQLGLRLEERHLGHNNLPLSLMFEPDESLGIEAYYQASRFTAADIDALLASFQTLCRRFVANPRARVADLHVLDDSAWTQIQGWSRGPEPGPAATVPALFHGNAARRGTARALVEGTRTWTYAAAARLVRHRARQLRRDGLSPGDRVGLYQDRTADMVINLLAVMDCGAAVVPLDPRLPAARCRLMLEDAEPKLVIGSGPHPDWMPEALTWLTFDALPADVEDDVEDDAGDGGEHPIIPSPTDTAYIIYTSGSTGKPKGVAVSHAAIANYSLAVNEALALPADAELTTPATVAADLGHTALYGALLTGRCLRLLPVEAAFDANLFAATLAEHPTDALKIVPSHLEALLAAEQPQRLLPRHTLISGGEALTAPLIEKLRALAPNLRIVNHYGPSEATVGVLTHRGGSEDRVVPVGLPLRGCEAWVLDSAGRPLPIGVPGELYLGGRCLADGYWRNEAQTRAVFVAHPFNAGARLYRSGDRVVRREDGALVFLGRVDDQVKIRGYRVEPGECAAWLRAQDEVLDAAVKVWSDERGNRLAGYWVPAQQTDADRLLEKMKAALPDYLVPADLMQLATLPLNLNGKVDRGQLPDPRARNTEKTAITAPQTPLETILHAIWCALFRKDALDIHANFFELGGDSILNLQVTAKARAEGVLFKPRDLFANPTIASLAAVAKRKNSQAAATPVASAPAALTPIQQWFFDGKPANVHHHNQSLLLRLVKPLETATLAYAIQVLLHRHEALRTRFEGAAFKPRALPVDEIVGVFSEHSDDISLKDWDRAVQSSLNIKQGPLWRVALRRGAAGDHLLLVCHHLVIDGVSWRLLLHDLVAALQNPTAPLPPLTASPQARWVAAARRWVGTEKARDTAARWRAQLPTEAPSFPNPPTSNRIGDSARVQRRLTAAQTQQLLHQSGAAYNTNIQELLVAAMVTALREWLPGEQVHLDMEGHGREVFGLDVDVSDCLGWFTARYPVAFPSATPDPVQRVYQVKETLRGLPAPATFGVLKTFGDGSLKGPAPRVSFNYLGQVDAGTAHGDLAEPVTGFEAADQDPNNPRRHQLNLIADIHGDVLHLNFSANRLQRDAATLGRLADSTHDALLHLIALTQREDLGGRQPCDFPLVDLDQTALDRLLPAPLWRRVADLYPTTPMQAGLLFHAVSDPDNDAYLNQFSCRLHGPLDEAVFEQAWQAAIQRHAVLRTGFVWPQDAAPLQVVFRDAPCPLHRADLRDLNAAAQNQVVADYLQEDRARGFDWQQAPLMRLALFRHGEDERSLVWTRHHVLMDGWCSALLIDEVLESYTALCQGRAPQRAAVKPYRDYIAWLQGRDTAEAEAYWRKRLAGFTETTSLPRRRGGHQGAAYGERELRFTSGETQQLQTFAAATGVTLNTLFQAAWALLLGRWCDRDAVLFGITAAGRPPEVEGVNDMLGLFINSLPLRLSAPQSGSVAAWLNEVQQHSAADRRFEQLALTRIHAQSELPGDAALFDSLLVFENYPGQDTVLPNGLRFETQTNVDRTHYPLTLIVQPDAELRVQFSYRREAFDAPFMERVAARFQMILQALTQADDLGEVTWFDPAELETAQTPEADFQPVQRWFESQVAAKGEQTAVIAGAQRLDYAGLNRAAESWAQVLLQRGARPGQRVAVALERGPRMMVAVLAVLKSGAAYVPLDTHLPPQRRQALLEQAQPLAVLTEQAVLARTGDLSPHQILMDEAPEAPAERLTALEPAAEDAAYLIYTSGSTGQPKGVLMNHGALNNLIAWHAARDLPGSITAFFAAFNFDVSFQEMLSTWAGGGTLVVVDAATRADSHAFIDLLAAHRVTRCFLPVIAFHHLTAALAERGQHLPALKQIITAGEALRLPDKVRRAVHAHLPGLTLSNHYGPSETHVVTSLDLEGDALTWPALPAIGRAITGVTAQVCDRRGVPLPSEVPGELWLGGAAVGLGYWNDAEQTAARFVAGEAGRRYRGGDRVVRDRDGLLHFLERIDRQVKIRGYRIEPAEIEQALGQHPDVDAAAVVVRAHAGTQSLEAFVATTRVSPEALRDHLRTTLPDYMVPARLTVLEALPLTTSGKLDRRALPAAGENDHEAPQSVWETRLCALFQNLLEREQVGPNDNFFECGGHSLLAARLIARLREESGAALKIRDLFERPTPRLLAALCETPADAARLPEPSVVDRDAPLPLSFGQQRLWFLDQLEGPQAAYNICLALDLKGALRPEDVEAALRLVLRNHEALRTRFESRGGSGRQVVEAEPMLHLAVSDAPDEAAVTRALQAEKNQVFDLERAPLLRTRLLRRGPDHHVLVLTCHHIVFDGWSVGILARDWAAAYRAVRAGDALAPSTALHYADFAAWQQRLLSGAELTQRRLFWQRKLTGLAAELPLRADFETVDPADTRGAACRHILPAETGAALHALCRAHQVTPFTALLGLFRVWLANHCGVSDFAIGAPDAGRHHPAFENTIGFFVDQMVLRAMVQADQNVVDLVRNERDGFLAAQNQNLPFPMLVELSGHPRVTGRNPLTQVQFNMHHASVGALDLPGLTATPREVDTVHARFPLALHAADEGDRLELSLVYRAAWFRPATVEAWLTEIAALITHALAEPTTQVAALWQPLQEQRQAKQARAEDHKAASLRNLRGRRTPRGGERQNAAPRGRRRAVRVSGDQLVGEQPLFPQDGFGLILTPNHQPFDGRGWIEAQRDSLHAKLQQHGALLLRGFNIAGEADLEQLIQHWCPSGPADYAFGSTPRSQLHGRIYTSTDYPADQMIPLHGENAYTNRWPMKVFFHCITAAEQGGETPIADMRAVYHQLDPVVRERFAAKKLLYVRNFSALAVSWQDAFQTKDRDAVAAYCRANGIDFTWLDASRLQTRQILAAVQRHPQTGEPLWFNQAHLFHHSALPEQVQRDLLAEMTPREFPRNVFYGDGSAIEAEALTAIRATLDAHTRAFPWQPGDVLVLDNMRCAHGRNPFQGDRKIVVGMAEAISAEQCEQENPSP